MCQDDLYKKSLRDQKMIAAQKEKRDPDLQRLSRNRVRESEDSRSFLGEMKDNTGSFLNGLLPSMVRHIHVGAAYYLGAGVVTDPGAKVAAGILAAMFTYAADRGAMKLLGFEGNEEDCSTYTIEPGRTSFATTVFETSLKLGVKPKPSVCAVGRMAGPLVAVGLAAYFAMCGSPQPDQISAPVSPQPKALVKLEARP